MIATHLRQKLGRIDLESRDDRAQVGAAQRERKRDIRPGVRRPRMALGPGAPDLPEGIVSPANERSRHYLRERALVSARSVLGGLHDEYSLAPALT